MADTKAHPDVIHFMTAFRRLREMIDDDPSGLEALTDEDESLRRLCLDVRRCASALRHAERGSGLFTAPVNAEFIKTWRDYEKRYWEPLSSVYPQWEKGELDYLLLTDKPPPALASHEEAARRSRFRARMIDAVLDFMEDFAA
jgi:hypothetical protein